MSFAYSFCEFLRPLSKNTNFWQKYCWRHLFLARIFLLRGKLILFAILKACAKKWWAKKGRLIQHFWLCSKNVDKKLTCLVKLKEQGKKVCKTYCAPMLSMHYLACDFLRSNSKLDWSAVKIPKSRTICTEPVKCCKSNLLSLEQVHNMYFTKGLSIYATGTLFPFFHPFSLISSQSKLKNFPHQNKMIFC